MVACLILLALRLSVPINLTAVDIGRHIKNGELILSGHSQVLYKNFYSFTYPDYSFINHHWLFGVIAYVVFQMGGFNGLAVSYIFLLVAAFFLAFDSARRLSSFNFALLLSGLSFLLLISRAEIRPEGVSVLFVALDFYLLQRYLQRSLGSRVLGIVIPVVQILWVNSHIFFFMGPLLIGVFLWQGGLAHENKQYVGFLRRLLLATILVNLINPSGFWGMLTPVSGIKHFGYELAENQSVFFMIKRMPQTIVYKYYLLTALLMAIGVLTALWRDRSKALPMVLLGVFITLAAFRAVRLIMPFGFLFIPLAAGYFAQFAKRRAVNLICGAVGGASIIFFMFVGGLHPQLGLMPRVNVSAEFFKQSGLKGPVFSNYDIGGYLIYHLQGQEKVFVDNRQEAFPPDFFHNVYIPMQEDESVWRQKQSQYGFNVIYFYRHDITPWGQDFLIKRIRDRQWAPVFVDDYAIIFVRRASIDQPVIDRYELPASLFRVVSNSNAGQLKRNLI